MDVNEVVSLAQWIEEYIHPANSSYEELVAALEQNANSTSKVAIRDLLEKVKKELLSMPVEQLTLQQTDLLNELEVRDLLGKEGWRFIERTVKEGNYDPASAAQDSRNAKQKLDKLVTLFRKTKQALHDVRIEGTPDYTDDKVTVRVRFTGGADIVNVVDLRKWSGEWVDISRGIALAVGERPEDVEVKGATTGSLILILGTTLSVATVLALIMKQVAQTVKSSMEIAHSLEDFKMKRLINKEIEDAFKKRRKEIEDGGVDETLTLVKEKLGDKVTNELEGGLKKSIEKVFSFASKGGEVDMLPPPEPETNPNEDPDEEVIDTIASIKEISDNIEEMRSIKAATQLLIEDQRDDEGEAE